MKDAVIDCKGGFRTERIDGIDGWTGVVLVDCPEPVRTRTGMPDLPPASAWLPSLQRLIDDAAQLPGREVLKYARDGEVVRADLELGGGTLPVVCRQTRTRRGWRGLVSRWVASREHRQFSIACKLLSAGIKTALPLVLLEPQGPGRHAWLVTQFVPGLVDLERFVLQNAALPVASRSRAVRNDVIAAVASLFRTFEHEGLHHRDLKASNILLTQTGAAAEEPVGVYVVDLDGVSTRTWMGSARRTQPLVRLAASLLYQSAVTRTDFVRFLHAYLGSAAAHGSSWKLPFMQLAARARRYADRARQRKSHKLEGYAG